LASTSKKVLVQRFDRESLSGFVNPRSWLHDEGLELLTLNGSVSRIPYSDIKLVSFVRDFESPGLPLERRAFQNRPKVEGLWLRMEFRDGDTLEGLHANSLLALEPQGFMVTPPDPSGYHQRLFIPRSALKQVQVLGVVGSPLRRAAKRKPAAREQIGLFESSSSG
jgi:hypothetical protein